MSTITQLFEMMLVDSKDSHVVECTNIAKSMLGPVEARQAYLDELLVWIQGLMYRQSAIPIGPFIEVMRNSLSDEEYQAYHLRFQPIVVRGIMDRIRLQCSQAPRQATPTFTPSPPQEPSFAMVVSQQVPFLRLPTAAEVATPATQRPATARGRGFNARRMTLCKDLAVGEQTQAFQVRLGSATEQEHFAALYDWISRNVLMAVHREQYEEMVTRKMLAIRQE